VAWYAAMLGHDLSEQLLRHRVGSSAMLSASDPNPRKTAQPLVARCPRRDLLPLRTGCPWRYLPPNFPPWQTVYCHFRRFRLSGMWHRILTTLRAAEQQCVGRDAQPTAAIIDAQSMKTVEESAPISGYDGHKNVKGRKRHLLVDSLGLPLSVYVTPADVQDRAGARRLLAGLKPLVPRLKKIWADGAYSGEELARGCEEEGGWELEVVERNREAQGFKVLAKRWIVERTFSWLIRNRRLSKDYERMVQSSETFIKVAMIRLTVRRLGGECEPYQTGS
jgi:putative transposase